MSLARRSITSISWNFASSFIRSAIVLLRSIVLARLLPVEVFGIYSFAGSIVVLSVVLPNFGMDGAFLHRAPETEDEAHAAALHFTLKFGFTLIWATLLTVVAILFTTGQQRIALLAMTAATAGIELTQTPKLLLIRRVVHRRLALLGLVKAITTTMIAIGMALQGYTLWAILATDFTNLLIDVFLLYIWRPVWRPSFRWSTTGIRYYLRFGSRNVLATLLLRAIDRVDDFWTGLYLGKTSLGFYSRAYTFASYPRQIISLPVNTVSTGTYAELKEDRLRRSRSAISEIPIPLAFSENPCVSGISDHSSVPARFIIGDPPYRLGSGQRNVPAEP